jgi:elongation factor 1-alpha
LDTLVPPKRPFDRLPRLGAPDVDKISVIGTMLVGGVESGIMKPDGDRGQAIMHHTSLPEAVPGDNIGFKSRELPRATSRAA